MQRSFNPPGHSGPSESDDPLCENTTWKCIPIEPAVVACHHPSVAFVMPVMLVCGAPCVVKVYESVAASALPATSRTPVVTVTV
jgi:hypothetical protein